MISTSSSPCGPFAGIDSALNYIPLLGRSVAAIKNSFLVASFNLKGPIDDPTITPAPLGTLTEWFWGVLGIPKSIIGLGEAEILRKNRKSPSRRRRQNDAQADSLLAQGLLPVR